MVRTTSGIKLLDLNLVYYNFLSWLCAVLFAYLSFSCHWTDWSTGVITLQVPSKTCLLLADKAMAATFYLVIYCGANKIFSIDLMRHDALDIQRH